MVLQLLKCNKKSHYLTEIMKCQVQYMFNFIFFHLGQGCWGKYPQKETSQSLLGAEHFETPLGRSRSSDISQNTFNLYSECQVLLL